MSPGPPLLVYGANAGRDTNDIDPHLPGAGTAAKGLTAGVELDTDVHRGWGSQHCVLRRARRRRFPRVMRKAAPRAVAGDCSPPPSRSPLSRRARSCSPPTGFHGQLFERAGRREAGIVFVHGGPPRQMLLGWHYMDYYSNALRREPVPRQPRLRRARVNYRLGIGYGHDFHHPPHCGTLGRSEYQDVKAGGEYLHATRQVDPRRIASGAGRTAGSSPRSRSPATPTCSRRAWTFTAPTTGRSNGTGLTVSSSPDERGTRARADAAWNRHGRVGRNVEVARAADPGQTTATYASTRPSTSRAGSPRTACVTKSVLPTTVQLGFSSHKSGLPLDPPPHGLIGS